MFSCIFEMQKTQFSTQTDGLEAVGRISLNKLASNSIFPWKVLRKVKFVTGLLGEGPGLLEPKEGGQKVNVCEGGLACECGQKVSVCEGGLACEGGQKVSVCEGGLACEGGQKVSVCEGGLGCFTKTL